MPSRASTSLLQINENKCPMLYNKCQCPLGLVPHCYRIRRTWELFQEPGCQCPLGLVPHCYQLAAAGLTKEGMFVSMPSRAVTSFLLQTQTRLLKVLWMCQCPLGLLPHFYYGNTWFLMY